MEKWLEKMIEESKRESQKSLEEMKKHPLKFSMSVEAGKESIGFDMNLTDMMEKLVLPTYLLRKGFDGIKNTIDSLGMSLKTDCKIAGYSQSEYIIPFYLEDREKQILFQPMYFSGFMEAFGLGELSYSAFAPFLALDFFKYIDIMNAQTKPTIMAFFGLTDFREIAEVNFLDFIQTQLKNLGVSTKEEDIQKSMKEKNIYEIIPQNMFKAYGIPEFRMQIKDAIRLTLFDPKKSSDKRRLRAYATSLGLPGFLNPTIVDYPLFVAHISGKTSPETVGEIMRRGKALGHSPSGSKLLPDLRPSEALNDPLSLMKEMKRLGMLTEIRGTYKLANEGLRLVAAEVTGKPKEWSLSKIWNVAKKAKDILPFLRFLSKT